MSGAGVLDYSEADSIEGRLIGFGIGRHGLEFPHIRWLENAVVPVLQGGGSVAVTGFASRTGTDADNLVLSQRRARTVINHLHSKLRSPMHFTIGDDYQVKQVSGSGETEPRDDGARDGSENAYYRAVLVHAWRKPLPPPLPVPKPKPPARQIMRVRLRHWNKFNSRMPGEAGEFGMDMAEIASDIIAGNTTGGTDKRETVVVPIDHVVVKVREEFTVDNNMGVGVSTTTYDWRVEYFWGPPTDTVFLLSRTRQIESGIDRGWRMKKRDHIQRDKIWKEVPAPDAAVTW